MRNMFRRSAAFLLSAPVLAVLMAAHAAAGIPPSASRAVQPVSGPGTGGTAFHVGGGCWITARHVAAAPVLRIVVSGRTYGAYVRRVHPDADVALLAGPDPGVRLALSTRTPQPGEPVWALGFPAGVFPRGPAVPVVGKVHPASGTDGLLWIDGIAFHGHSGSPVFDRTSGVAGVVVGAHPVWDDVTFAEPARRILELVQGRCS